MKAYYITYDGIWLGGKAVVLAESEDEALDLVKNDKATIEFTDVGVEEVHDLTEAVVLYNDSGDY
jgi:hypothetical protein